MRGCMQSIEEIDLAALARFVRERVPTALRSGAIMGRTAIRDAIAAHLGSSELVAENLVDTMIARGFFTLIGSERDSDPETWLVRSSIA